MAGLFSKPETPVAPTVSRAPEIEPVKAMPVSNTQERKRIRKKSTANQRRRGGRTSTILTSQDKLGG